MLAVCGNPKKVRAEPPEKHLERPSVQKRLTFEKATRPVLNTPS